MKDSREPSNTTTSQPAYVTTMGEESSALLVDGTLEKTGPRPQAGAGVAMFYSLAGRVGLLLLDSATGIVCARLLGPEGRGELTAMILGPVFLAQAFTLGLPSAIIYNLRQQRQDAGPFIGAAITMGIVMSVVASTVGILVLPYWLHLYSRELIRHAQFFMLGSIFSMAAVIFRGVWESMGGFGKSAMAQVLSRIGTLTSLVFFLSIHKFSPYTAAVGYVVLGSIPPFLWTCAAIVPKAKWKIQQMIAAGKILLSYGIRSYGIDLCGTLAQYVDQALVLGMLSAAHMGTYTVALSLSRVLNLVSVSMAAVLFPKAIGGTPQRVVSLAIRTLIGSLTLGILGGLFIVFFGSFMLNLLYGRDYLVATTALKILTLEALISGSLTVLSQPFMALGRPGIVTLLQVAGLLTSIPLLFLLVPQRGAEGAAIALVCSALIRGVLLCICYQRFLPGTFRWSVVPEEFQIVLNRLRLTGAKKMGSGSLKTGN